MSRRAILLRVLIFGPLFAYFGFFAIQKCRAQKQADADADAAAAAREDGPTPTRKLPLPNGGSIDVYEVTPEEAKRLGLNVPEEPAKAPGPPADARPPEAGKAPDARAPDAKSDAEAN